MGSIKIIENLFQILNLKRFRIASEGMHFFKEGQTFSDFFTKLKKDAICLFLNLETAQLQMTVDRLQLRLRVEN